MFKLIKAAALILGAIFCLPLSAAHADASGCQFQPAVDSFVEPGTRGRGKLCVLPGRLQGQVRFANLIPGNAYTVWWTYQDDPSLCTDDASLTGGASLTGEVSDCEIPDFFGDKPLGIFGRMASGVAPKSGRLTLRGVLGGMVPSSGSEVWFWLFAHGPSADGDAAALARQLLTPEDPAPGAPHLGNIVDGQRGFPAATVVFTVD